MPNEFLTDEDVLTAATALVDAFRATDTRAYFGSFAEDATFVFHTEQRRLDSRAAYEQLWAGWLADGWRVTGCISSNPRVQLLGDTAVFTHDVRTTTSVDGVSDTTRERETIVFRRSGTAVEAVHEHLSPIPADSPEEGA
ncbi:nuclear transport factor 2 family protein [Arthrobacter sp. MDT1-65]